MSKQTRGDAHRPSSSYPREYQSLYWHVLQTGEEVRIDTLGTDRARYTTLVQDMNRWRYALKREHHHLADAFYGITPTKQVQEPGKSWEVWNSRRSYHKDSKYSVLLRAKSTDFSEALQGLVPEQELPGPPIPNADPNARASGHPPEPRPILDSPFGTRSLEEIFGSVKPK